MKFKIVKQTLPETANRLLELMKVDEDVGDVGSVFDKTFDSVGSGVRILDGSFSAVKPLNPEPKKEPITAPSTSTIEFKPPVISTPIYETISDSESDDKVESDWNSTFNEEEFVTSETASYDKYLTQVVQLITSTQNMLEEKKSKRVKLNKKLAKHKKKVTQIQKAIGCLDRLITFGEQIPRLLDNI